MIEVRQETSRVLVVEDEDDLRELICTNLGTAGYRCLQAADGKGALELARGQSPDLIVLDRMLPEMSGDDCLVRLKRDRATASIPVIVLTAKVEESDLLFGFALGADDYVTKPFSMRVLAARIDAVLRRADHAARGSEVRSAGPIGLDPARHEVTVDGQPVALTPSEFGLLHWIMRAEGRVVDRPSLMRSVFEFDTDLNDRRVDVHMAALRKKLGPAAGWIQTIRGVGFACRPPDAASSR